MLATQRNIGKMGLIIERRILAESIGLRIKIQDLHAVGIQAGFRNHISRELSAAIQRVLNRQSRSATVMRLREIAHALKRRRNRDIGQAVGPQLLLPLAADEEEKLFLILIEDARNVGRPAHVESGAVVTIIGPGAPIDIVAPTVGIQIVMAMEEIASAVEVPRAGLGNNFYLGPGRASEFRRL